MKRISLLAILAVLPMLAESGFTVRVYKRVIPLPGEPAGVHYVMAFHTDDSTITGVSGEAVCIHADGTRESQVPISAPVSLGGSAWKFITCTQPSKILIAASEIRGTGRGLRTIQEPEDR